ncbi:MAG: ankyrin repeat domain-containing protein [Gaiellaceae bacterium]
MSDRLNLAAAQLALAREYGFASWARLKDEVEARTLTLSEKVAAFCEAIVSTRPARAARILAETPEIGGYNFATAVLLGDVDRVRDTLRHEPGLATQRDPRNGWTALHAACASRLHQLDPTRADDLAAVARLLIDAGADPLDFSGRWTPLGCAIAGTNSGNSNRPIVELLLGYGAIVDDEGVYLAGFAHDRHELLPLLLNSVSNVAETAEQALAAPLSNNDSESVRILLEAGADPRRYNNDNGEPSSPVCEAIRLGCSLELVELLLTHGADANADDAAGRSPYRLATATGRQDLADLLLKYGARDDTTAVDRFLFACVHANRDEAQRQLAQQPALLDQLTHAEHAALTRAAEKNNTDAVALMLDVGFPLETQSGEWGATPLHAAAYSGSADTVRLLLDHGADTEARDPTWNSTPLEWAAIGSGEQPNNNPAPNWPNTVRTLLQAGAATDEITLTPGDPKQPSPEVADLLRPHLERHRR